MGAKKTKAVKRPSRKLVPVRKPVKKRKRPTVPPRNNGKHPGGRPSLYTPDMVDQVERYLKEYRKHGDLIPSVVGLAAVLDVARDTVIDWGRDKDKPEFSYMLKKIQTIQERTLLNGGLGGTLNAAITKLALAKHGYHDKIDNEHTGKDGAPIEHRLSKALSPEELAREYQEFSRG